MRLQGKKIAFLISEGVEDYEYFVPLMRLQEEGAQVLSAAMDLKSIHGKNGLKITPDTLIESLNADELFSISSKKWMMPKRSSGLFVMAARSLFLPGLSKKARR
jgi:putative intracellular protease/amidase